jgi:hypothetical protein
LTGPRKDLQLLGCIVWRAELGIHRTQVGQRGSRLGRGQRADARCSTTTPTINAVTSTTGPDRQCGREVPADPGRTTLVPARAGAPPPPPPAAAVVRVRRSSVSAPGRHSGLGAVPPLATTPRRSDLVCVSGSVERALAA